MSSREMRSEEREEGKFEKGKVGWRWEGKGCEEERMMWWCQRRSMAETRHEVVVLLIAMEEQRVEGKQRLGYKRSHGSEHRVVVEMKEEGMSSQPQSKINGILEDVAITEYQSISFLFFLFLFYNQITLLPPYFTYKAGFFFFKLFSIHILPS